MFLAWMFSWIATFGSARNGHPGIATFYFFPNTYKSLNGPRSHAVLLKIDAKVKRAC
jgi:hypothetical protein